MSAPSERVRMKALAQGRSEIVKNGVIYSTATGVSVGMDWGSDSILGRQYDAGLEDHEKMIPNDIFYAKLHGVENARRQKEMQDQAEAEKRRKRSGLLYQFFGIEW